MNLKIVTNYKILRIESSACNMYLELLKTDLNGFDKIRYELYFLIIISQKTLSTKHLELNVNSFYVENAIPF